MRWVWLWAWGGGCASDEPPPELTLADQIPSAWEAVPLLSPALVWAEVDGEDRLALDSEGQLLRFGEEWTPSSPAAFPGGWVVDADLRDGSVWAVDEDTLAVWHADDLWPVWDHIDAPFDRVQSVLARADGTVWVLHEDSPGYGDSWYSGTADGRAVHMAAWDGAQWTRMEAVAPQIPADFTETPEGELVAVGWGGWIGRWTGEGWEDVAPGLTGARFADVEPGPEGIVAVGSGGTVVRGSLAALEVSTIAGAEDLIAVDVSASGDVWSLDNAQGFWRGAGPEARRISLPVAEWWQDVAADGEYAWVVGLAAGSAAVHAGPSDDSAPFAYHRPGFTALADLVVDDLGQVWFRGGEQQIGRWSGGTLETWTAPFRVLAIAAAGGRAVAGGYGAWEWDGATWTDLGFFASVVSVAGDGSAFAASGTTGMARTDGAWSPLAPPEVLYSAAVIGDLEVYAVGVGNDLLRSDGGSWETLATLRGDPWATESVWGRAGDDLYVAHMYVPTGDRPNLLHWDGSELVAITGAPGSIYAMGGDDAGRLVIGAGSAEEGFAIHRYGPDGWGELLRVGEFVRVSTNGGVTAVSDGKTCWSGPSSAW